MGYQTKECAWCGKPGAYVAHLSCGEDRYHPECWEQRCAGGSSPLQEAEERRQAAAEEAEALARTADDPNALGHHPGPVGPPDDEDDAVARGLDGGRAEADDDDDYDDDIDDDYDDDIDENEVRIVF